MKVGDEVTPIFGKYKNHSGTVGEIDKKGALVEFLDGVTVWYPFSCLTSSPT